MQIFNKGIISQNIKRWKWKQNPKTKKSFYPCDKLCTARETERERQIEKEIERASCKGEEKWIPKTFENPL